MHQQPDRFISSMITRSGQKNRRLLPPPSEMAGLPAPPVPPVLAPSAEPPVPPVLAPPAEPPINADDRPAQSISARREAAIAADDEQAAQAPLAESPMRNNRAARN